MQVVYDSPLNFDFQFAVLEESYHFSLQDKIERMLHRHEDL